MSILLFILLLPLYLAAQWNPNAGIIPSYTNNAVVTATSGIKINAIIDGDDDTNWVSGAPFPSDFITRTDQNIFLTAPLQVFASATVTNNHLTDGNLNTSISIAKAGNTAFVELQFDQPINLKWLSIKLSADSTVYIQAITPASDTLSIASHNKNTNFQLLRYTAPAVAINKIRLSAASTFLLFEVAGLTSNPKESITVDLGEVKQVGKVYLRHWAGTNAGQANAEKVELQVSSDFITWQVIANLKPDALPILITDLETAIPARYLRVEYTVLPIDFLKVFCWEIDAYDENGKFGAVPAPSPSKVTIRELLGVSGIWGWGNNKYSDLLPAGQGAFLYAPVFSHARNYHNMTWDVLDPDHIPDFETMAKGLGTAVFPWLNWDREYKIWRASGMDVQVTIQIEGFADSLWNHPSTASYNYGLDFARHFGFNNGVNLIRLLEVGNEPWNYDSTTYREILHGMAMGVKAGDPNMKVLPCALQAVDPEAELPNSPFNNYIGSRILPETAPYLDGLNAHIYSYHNQPDGMRYAPYPEYLNSTMREILNIIRFRDANMPGKPIHCTEWGWDHGSPNTESCTHDECVSEQAAAAYAIRGALFLMRLGIERATWYFYGDTKTTSSLYTRSGVTGSVRNNFKKKKSYYALQTLVNQIGNKRFLGTLMENDTAWIYVFGDTLQMPTHLIAWKPTHGDSLSVEEVEVVGNYIPLQALKIDGNQEQGTLTTLPKYKNGSLQIAVNSVPTLIAVDTCTNCPNMVLVDAKALLQGAYRINEPLLQHQWNQLGLLPIQPLQPSTDALGTRNVNIQVFEKTGEQAVVDWISVELWSSTEKLATRTGLLLRNGKIVDVDGISPLAFYGFNPGDYYVAIRHRHHLGVKTAQAYSLSGW